MEGDLNALAEFKGAAQSRGTITYAVTLQQAERPGSAGAR
jgi:hypothetical protein